MTTGEMTTGKRLHGEDDDDVDTSVDDDGVDTFVEDEIEVEIRDPGDRPPKKKRKKSKKDASLSNTSAVHDPASPPTVSSRKSHSYPIRRLSFSNDQRGAPESSIVTKRLKDLCSRKEPTVNVGIEIVGAAYLLKQMATKRHHDDRDNDDDKIRRAMKMAVKATKLLFHADHVRNNALQLLSKSQKLFENFL
ncbi:hypothetical protein K1719_046241 [Acacia pycnantha]|nr:hypothetical protein K1719_046241 [Acacia pycnantha]